MVILLRFGLEDRQARTLEEVGKEFNVSESGSVRLKLRCYSSCAIPAEPGNSKTTWNKLARHRRHKEGPEEVTRALVDLLSSHKRPAISIV